MKPTLRIIHNLARSGGTVICRCLGCMDGVALLSEIHPDSKEDWNSPSAQALHWHGLYNSGAWLSVRQKSFVEEMVDIEARARAEGKTLVVRDWSHIDFMPSHFNHTPSMRPRLVEELRDHFDLRRIAITREPEPMWASLATHGSMAGDVNAGRFTPSEFMAGFKAYAEQMEEVPSISYENFMHASCLSILNVCEVLEIALDANWPSKWRQYQKITGCIDNTKALPMEFSQ